MAPATLDPPSSGLPIIAHSIPLQNLILPILCQLQWSGAMAVFTADEQTLTLEEGSNRAGTSTMRGMLYFLF